MMRSLQGKWIHLAGLVLACSSLQGLATASVISNTGTFVTDDQIFQLEFTLSSTSAVTIQSFGYGGGTNGAGIVIPQGGFATDLTLFFASGPQFFILDDSGGSLPGGCAPRNVNSSTNQCLDGYLSFPSLAAGSYILTLTETGNQANTPTLADGFAQAGAGNFTGGPFIDPFSNQMNGNWAVDVSSDALVGSNVPEPSTILLALLSLSGLAIVARRRCRS
jgi:hypothetical protein